MANQNEIRIDFLISRYQRGIFSLILHLIGGDKNAAYDITASSFVKSFQACPTNDADTFFVKLAAAAVAKSREARVMPAAEEAGFQGLPAVKRKTLQITRAALYALPFESKALLLLRDQMHLPYKTIAAILKMPEKDVRVATNSAKVELRKEIEKLLTRERKTT